MQSKTQLEEKRAVEAGYWPLYRFNPDLKEQGKNLEKYQNIIESDRERLEQLYSRLGSDISGIAEKSLQSQFKGVVGALNNQTVKLNQATNLV